MDWLARFLVVVAFLAIGVVFSPESLGTKSDMMSGTGVKLVYLLSFSTAWGMALWVTFIGGIIMFKNLPRHQFGNLQSKMFPMYFGVAIACCGISMISFAALHNWDWLLGGEIYQFGFLCTAFLLNLVNYAIFTPMTIKMMKDRHKVERELNVGEEVGWSKNQQAAKVNPELTSMNKKFGMIHGLSSLANIISFGSLAMHSWYIARKINV